MSLRARAARCGVACVVVLWWALQLSGPALAQVPELAGGRIPTLAPLGRTEGAVIAEVIGGSPAETAGLRKGDIVVSADGAPIRSAAQLRNKISLAALGSRVELRVERAHRFYKSSRNAGCVAPAGRPDSAIYVNLKVTAPL